MTFTLYWGFLQPFTSSQLSSSSNHTAERDPHLPQLGCLWTWHQRKGVGWGNNQAGGRAVGREVKQKVADWGPQEKEQTAGRGTQVTQRFCSKTGEGWAGEEGNRNLSRTPLQPLYLEPDLSQPLLPSVAPCWELAARPSGSPYCWNLVLKEPRRLLWKRHLRSLLQSQSDAALVWAQASLELNLAWEMWRWPAGPLVS